jgi:hypothetical protein
MAERKIFCYHLFKNKSFDEPLFLIVSHILHLGYMDILRLNLKTYLLCFICNVHGFNIIIAIIS